jgi:hypothetical protein
LQLDWPKNFNICVGKAHGLNIFMKIHIHEDFKTFNILLEKQLYTSSMTFFVSLYGIYLVLKYLSLGQFDDKINVYSFGILLLATIGKKNSDVTLSTNKNYLLEWVSANCFFSLCTFIKCLWYHVSHNKLEMFTYKCVNRSYAINIPS